MRDNKKYCVWTLINSEGKFINPSYKKKGRSWVINTIQWVDKPCSYNNYSYMSNAIEEIKTLGHKVDGVSIVNPLT
jgi:hypothetical protein